jgi:pilus assembly protein FimV
MKKLLTHGPSLAGTALLTCMAGAYAQSLGEPAAELWIGMPLEVTIPARFASADSRDTCVHAEVFYGDTALAPSQVRTTMLGTDEHRRVRITADRIVDEPLVKVSLRAGCASTVTRSYTLLPDMPSEAVLARLLQPAPAPAALGTPLSPVAQSIMAARVESGTPAVRAIPAMARAAVAPP